MLAMGNKLAGHEYRAADEHTCVARSNPDCEVVGQPPEWLRFGSAAHLLRVLSSCVENLFRFWQCVVERMKPYEFYFLDPRLVSID
jgi:hypothetical protein